jgi:hypothetical protein
MLESLNEFGETKYTKPLISYFNRILDWSWRKSTLPTSGLQPITQQISTIDPLNMDIKIKVQNEAEAKAFQEWAFSKGVEWIVRGVELANLDEMYLTITKGNLCFYGKRQSNSRQGFEKDSAQLVTLAELGITLDTI